MTEKIYRRNYFCESQTLLLVITLKAIASSGHRQMKMNRFIIEHLGLLRVVVVICNINLVNGALKPGDLKTLKRDIPDPVPGSWGGFLTQLVLR